MQFGRLQCVEAQQSILNAMRHGADFLVNFTFVNFLREIVAPFWWEKSEASF